MIVQASNPAANSAANRPGLSNPTLAAAVNKTPKVNSRTLTLFSIEPAPGKEISNSIE